MEKKYIRYWLGDRVISLDDIAEWDEDGAKNISFACDEGQERWRQYATLKSGEKIAIIWVFPDEVLRDEDGDRFEDDGLLPWDDMDYVEYFEEAD